jgi:hypothetical protein
MALESEKVNQNAMQLRMIGIHQFHLTLFGNGILSRALSPLSLIWYSMRTKRKSFRRLCGRPGADVSVPGSTGGELVVVGMVHFHPRDFVV